MGRRANPTRRRNYGSNHGYILDGEEIKGRGVTTILGLGFPKNGLQYWAAKQVAGAAVDEQDIWRPLLDRSRDAAFEYLKEAPFRDRDAAARKGTDVHRLGEQLQNGETVEVPDELVGHVDSYLEFMEDFDPVDPIVEGVVVSRKYRYMGTFDLIATLNCGRPDGAPEWWPTDRPARLLLDVKTSRSGIYPEICMQMAGYRYAEVYLPDPAGGDEVPMPEVDGCAALHVRADGYDLIPVEVGQREFRLFLYVDQVAQFLGTWKEPGWSSQVLGEPLTPGVLG